MMKTKHGTKYVKRILIASTKWKLKEMKKKHQQNTDIENDTDTWHTEMV